VFPSFWGLAEEEACSKKNNQVKKLTHFETIFSFYQFFLLLLEAVTKKRNRIP
jgi:hypothetical protein